MSLKLEHSGWDWIMSNPFQLESKISILSSFRYLKQLSWSQFKNSMSLSQCPCWSYCFIQCQPKHFMMLWIQVWKCWENLTLKALVLWQRHERLWAHVCNLSFPEWCRKADWDSTGTQYLESVRRHKPIIRQAQEGNNEDWTWRIRVISPLCESVKKSDTKFVVYEVMILHVYWQYWVKMAQGKKPTGLLVCCQAVRE